MGLTNKHSPWKTRFVGGALALSAFGGCKQQLFVEPADYKDAMAAGLPAKLETHPHAPIAPSELMPGTAPATVLDPSRPPRFLTLKEAIAIAVEQGNLGSQGGLQNGGFANDNLPSFSGRQVSGTDSIKALVLDPAIVGADIERALSKFDARWINSMSWNKQDQPTLTLQQSFSNGDQANFSSTLAKPLPTGGLAGLTMSMNYQNLSNPPSQQGFVALPTSYTPRMQFIFEQPLLQSFGIEINQLSAQHPGSQLIAGLRPSGGTTTEGILITRIRYDQQRAAFDQQINQMLYGVEAAYWNLYSAYYNLYAQEDVLRQVYSLFTVLNAREGAGTIPRQDLEQVRAQYYRFRRQVLQARNQVLTAERNLRGLLGDRSDKAGDRLVPVDEPTLAPFTPDWGEAAATALASRPELTLARHDLKYRQLDLVLQKNLRRPDLRFFSSYDIQGLGSRLDGPGSRPVPGVNGGPPTSVSVNALDSFNNNQFNSWQLGLRLDMPLGFRDANAAVRQGQLNLYKSFFQLHDAERKTLEVVTQQYREVIFRYEEIRYARGERLADQDVLRLQKLLIDSGKFELTNLFNLLTTQRDTATAIASEFQAIAEYNKAIAGLEFAKGTIQRYNNVSVGEGPLPAHVQKKAAEHFRAREAALKLREHPAELALTGLTTPWNPGPDALPGAGAPGSPIPATPPTTPAAPAPMPLPTPTPVNPQNPPLPAAAANYQPGQPAPTTVTPFPTGGGTAADAASPFRPIDTVKLPRRGTAEEPK